MTRTITAEKGFGFVADTQGQYFFHRSAVQGANFDDLREGVAVECDTGQGPKCVFSARGPRLKQ